MANIRLEDCQGAVLSMDFFSYSKEMTELAMSISQGDFFVSVNEIITLRELLVFKENIQNLLDGKTDRFELYSLNDDVYVAMLKITPTELYCNIKITFDNDKNNIYNSFFCFNKNSLSSAIIQLEECLIALNDSLPKKESTYVVKDSGDYVQLALNPQKVLIDKEVGEKAVFAMTMLSEHARVERQLMMWADEFLSFKGSLLRLSQDDYSFVFEPLGEFTLLRFERSMNKITLHLEMLDTNWPQNELYLNGTLSFPNINQLIYSLEEIYHSPKGITGFCFRSGGFAIRPQ